MIQEWIRKEDPEVRPSMEQLLSDLDECMEAVRGRSRLSYAKLQFDVPDRRGGDVITGLEDMARIQNWIQNCRSALDHLPRSEKTTDTPDLASSARACIDSLEESGNPEMVLLVQELEHTPRDDLDSHALLLVRCSGLIGYQPARGFSVANLYACVEASEQVSWAWSRYLEIGLYEASTSDSALRKLWELCGPRSRPLGQDESVVIGEIQSMNALDQALILRVLVQHRAQLMACFNDAREHAPAMSGQMKIYFRATDTGAPIELRVTETPVESAALEKCLLDRISELRFPTRPSADFASILVPIYFGRAAADARKSGLAAVDRDFETLPEAERSKLDACAEQLRQRDLIAYYRYGDALLQYPKRNTEVSGGFRQRRRVDLAEELRNAESKLYECQQRLPSTKATTSPGPSEYGRRAERCVSQLERENVRRAAPFMDRLREESRANAGPLAKLAAECEEVLDVVSMYSEDEVIECIQQLHALNLSASAEFMQRLSAARESPDQIHQAGSFCERAFRSEQISPSHNDACSARQSELRRMRLRGLRAVDAMTAREVLLRNAALYCDEASCVRARDEVGAKKAYEQALELFARAAATPDPGGHVQALQRQCDQVWNAKKRSRR